MTDVPLRIRIRAEGSGDIKRELAQTTRAVAKAEEDAVKAAQKAEAAKRRERQRTDRAHERQIEDQARGEQDAIRDTLSEFERAERRKRDAMARTYRDSRGRLRDGNGRFVGGGGSSGRVPRSNGMPGGGGSGSSGTLNTMLASVGGLSGVVAAVASAVNVFNSRVQTSTQILGLQSNEEILSAYQNLDLELTNALLDANATPEQAERVRSQVLEQVSSRGIAPEEVIALLGQAQGQFDALIDFADNLDTFGRVAVATGSNIADVGISMGVAQRQLNLSADDFGSALGVMAAQAAAGSIELKNLSGEFAPVMGTFANATGREGEAALREFGAMAQTIGTLDLESASEGSTVMERTLDAMLNPERQARFQEIGLQLTGDDGRLRNIGDIMQDLAANETFNTPMGFADAVGADVNAQRGFRALRDTARRDPEFFRRLAEVDSEDGMGRLREREAAISQREAFKARQLRGTTAANVIRQGEGLLSDHRSRASDLANFRSENVGLAEWIPEGALPLVAEEWQTQQRNMNGPEGSGVQFGSLSRGLLGIFGGSLGLALGGGIPGLPVGTPAAMPGAVKGVNAESERLTQATESTASALARLDVSVQANTRAQRAAAAAASAGADTGGAPPAGVE